MKTYLSETSLAITAALLFTFSSPAQAGFFSDLEQFVANFGTAHEADGYRDTGCDPAFQVDLGGYSNNPTCPAVGGAPDDLTPTPVAVEPEEPEEEEPEEPEEPPVEECKRRCGPGRS